MCFNPYFRWTYVYTTEVFKCGDDEVKTVSILVLDGLMFIQN